MNSKSLKNILIRSASATTMHGLPNMVRTKRLLVRIVWAFCFLIAFALCAYLIIESLMKTLKTNKKVQVPSLLDSSSIGTAAELASLPTETVWKNALNFCSQLNNLLKRLNFPSLSFQPENEFLLLDRDNYNEEQKYFIGLTYNSNK